MRIIASLSPEPSFWVENVHDIGQVRSSVQIACTDFVFVMNESDREKAKQNLMNMMNMMFISGG